MQTQHNLSDQHLSTQIQAIGNHGEIPLVPSETDDLILSLDEVRMEFGDPVVNGGVDYGELIRLYRQALYDEACDDKFRKWNERPLSDFHRTANRHEMAYCHKLLTERDKAEKRGANFKEFFRELKEFHNYSETDRTLRRQIAHARLAMVLAAKGMIDRLPSQNVSGVISANLPRQAWVPFLKKHPVKRGQPSKIKSLVEEYCARTGTPVRLQAPRSSALPKLASTVPTPAITETTEVHETEAPSEQPLPTRQQPKKIQVKKVAKLLALQLSGVVPVCHLESPEVLAKAILERLDKSASSVPRPTRHEKLDQLAAVLTTLDPVRADGLAKAAMRLMLGAALDTAIQKVGASKKSAP